MNNSAQSDQSPVRHEGVLTVFRASQYRFTLSASFKDEATGKERTWDRAPKAFEQVITDPYTNVARIAFVEDERGEPRAAKLLEHVHVPGYTLN